jgi:hypothetical protein
MSTILGDTTTDPSSGGFDANGVNGVPTAPTANAGASDGSNDIQEAQAAQPTSRLAAIIGAVAKVASTGLSGIPDRGRPSFVTGLGEGARAEKENIANQNAIKFRDFDSQVRIAQLHNQDKKLQLDTQEQTDAHTKAELDNRALANSLGIDYDSLPSHGPAVMDNLTAQTAANGAASVPAGTHLSGDGETINIPQDTQKTRDGQKQMYNMLGPALGLPPLPQGAQFVPPKNMNMLTNKIHGFTIAGEAPKHDDLPGMIGAEKLQRDTIAKNGATPEQLKALDNMIAIHQANLEALDEHSAGLKKKQKQADLEAESSPEALAAVKAKKQAELDVTNSPANQAAAATGAGQKSAAEQAAKDAASTKMFVGTDKDGNQIAGTHDDLVTAGASGVTKLDDDSGKKVITARQLTSPSGLFAQIHQDMLNLKAKGKLGSAFQARFNDALLQKAGSDPDYAPLFVHTHLLSTALMQAHVGSKGSEGMMEEFGKLANSGKMSADTLRSALGAEYNYVHEKAMLPKKVSQ